MPYPFQIVQSGQRLFACEFTASRVVINTQRRAPRRRDGWNVGKGRRITVVEVTDHMPDTWFDRAGIPQRRAQGHRALHADRREHDESKEDRGSERVLEADDQDAALSTPRAERAAGEYKCVPFTEELLCDLRKSRSHSYLVVMILGTVRDSHQD
jgi:hypothetical protein